MLQLFVAELWGARAKDDSTISGIVNRPVAIHQAAGNIYVRVCAVQEVKGPTPDVPARTPGAVSGVFTLWVRGDLSLKAVQSLSHRGGE